MKIRTAAVQAVLLVGSRPEAFANRLSLQYHVRYSVHVVRILFILAQDQAVESLSESAADATEATVIGNEISADRVAVIKALKVRK